MSLSNRLAANLEFSMKCVRGLATSKQCRNLIKSVKSGQVKKLNNNTLLQRTTKSLSINSTQSFGSKPAEKNITKDDIEDFRKVFPVILHDSMDITGKNNYTECAAWFGRSMEYNLLKGSLLRGCFAVSSYARLMEGQDLNAEKMHLARILGWCVEMNSASILIWDDVLDKGTTRDGQICWHNLQGVGLQAVNDIFMMNNAVYALLKKYFGNTDYYVPLMELFHKVSFMTACGQCMDVLSEGKPVTTFTMEMFNQTAVSKTSYFSLFLPFAAAAHMARIKEPEVFRQSQFVLNEIACLFQAQNDFLDCFGNQTIRNGTDIRDNKCSWLAATCMELANYEQIQIMLDCYGKKDPEKEEKVRELYKSLDLPKKYAIYEKKTCDMIKTHIGLLSCGIPHDLFLNMLDKLEMHRY